MDKEAWWATVHGVTKNWLWLNTHARTHAHTHTQTYTVAAAAAAKSLQSCPTLCNPVDCSLPGFSAHGSLQARTRVGCHFLLKWKVKVKSFSRVWLLATHGLQPTRLLHPWDFPGNSTGVGCHYLLPTYTVITYKCESLLKQKWLNFR